MRAQPMESRDTHVRVDIRSPNRDTVDLVLYTPEGGVVITGTEDSILMLVDRINDRVNTSLRRGHADGG